MDIDPHLEHPNVGVAGPSSNNFHTHTEMLSRTRVQSTIANVNPAPTHRKRRTCRKCALTDCPGSQKVSNCKNACRDCGRVDCRGRNARRLHKTCFEGWEWGWAIPDKWPSGHVTHVTWHHHKTLTQSHHCCNSSLNHWMTGRTII
jgi:hypothetical protein